MEGAAFLSATSKLLKILRPSKVSFLSNLEHGIKAVLTAAKGVDLTHSKADVPYYLQIQGEDRDGFDLTRFFPQAINFITEALETTSIMVHCLAGVSRSVCLVLAYFIKCKGMSYDEAYRFVKSKRSIVILVWLRSILMTVLLVNWGSTREKWEYVNLRNRPIKKGTRPLPPRTTNTTTLLKKEPTITTHTKEETPLSTMNLLPNMRPWTMNLHPSMPTSMLDTNLLESTIGTKVLQPEDQLMSISIIMISTLLPPGGTKQHLQEKHINL